MATASNSSSEANSRLRASPQCLFFIRHDIVLVDAVTAEKIFYSSLPEWNQKLEPESSQMKMFSSPSGRRV